ncbi:NAD(P)H-binding protein [Blastococcus sp. SYSU D00695]
MNSDLVLVTGATGKTARRVLPRLRLRGADVRAASRSSRVRLDWSDPSTWDAALQDVTTMYLVPPGDPAHARPFVERAEAAGVRHVVVLSARGAGDWGDADFGQDMNATEKAVQASSMSWTMLRPTNFDQNFDEDVFHEPLLAGELALPAAGVTEVFIDAEDIADVAVAALTDPDAHAGRAYELTGPRSYTFAEATETIARISGEDIAYREVSGEEYAGMLTAHGVPALHAEHVVGMFWLMAQGGPAEPTDDVARVLGRPARTFEDYVVRAAAAGAWRRTGR